MESGELLATAIRSAETLGIPYMLVGSLASMRYGEPRLTLDFDIVVDLTFASAEKLCQAFGGPDYYVSLPAAIEAVRHRKQFNVLHPKSGMKIDFMIARQDAWGRRQLERRRKVELYPGQHCDIAAPEDVILGKLLYYREGQSDKHLRDIAAMLQTSGDEIDRADVAAWATKLDVLDIWQAIVARVDAAPK
ncbi:MAG TPA: hypothetical protein VGM98_05865 [Schlesneria sp.]